MNADVMIPSPQSLQALSLLRMKEVHEAILNLPVNLTVGVRAYTGYEVTMALRKRKIAYLIAMLASHLNVTSARLIANVSQKDLESWRKTDEHFKSVEASLYDDILDLAEEKLHEAIGEGDMKAVQFLLRTKGRNRGYVEKMEMDHGVQDFEQALLKGRQRALANSLGKDEADETKDETPGA